MYDRIVKVARTNFFIPETIVGLGVLVAINAVFLPSKPAFAGINPHPFWIIVLAISLRYGRGGALFAGIAAATVFVAHILLLGGVDALYDDLWILRYPILFILVGFMAGEVKTVFILREDYLTSRLEELENQNDTLVKENEIVKEAHRVLTANVATKQDTITILNEITGRLKSYDPDVIFNGILQSFRENLGAEECSVYAPEGNELKLAFSDGWQDYHRRPTSFATGEGLVGAAAEAGRAMSVKEFIFKKHAGARASSDLMGDSVLAIPIVGLEGRLFGVASIEKLPLIKLTETTIQTAKVICELAASSLNNAVAFHGMEERQIRDASFDLYKYHFFSTRLGEELTRSMSYMIPLSAMAFHWPKLKGLSDSAQAPIVASIITILKSGLRAFDVLARGPNEATPFVLLLATTSRPQAEEMKRKIVAKLEDYELSPLIADGPLPETIAVAAYDPHTIFSAEDMLRALGT